MGVSREILRKKTSDIPLICTMKTFAVILACLVATIRADITCEDCLVFGGAMSDYLQSEASLAEQTAILAAALCPGESDPAGCEEALNTYWSQIGLAMYPVFLDPTAVCGELGVCKVKSVLAEPTCDECTASVVLVSEVIKSDAKIADIVAFLQGDFCDSVGEEGCVEGVAYFMPKAMPVLAGVLAEKAGEYCCTLSPAESAARSSLFTIPSRLKRPTILSRSST